MKILILVMLIFVSILLPIPKNGVSASSYKYARAMNGNVNLYKLSTDDSSIDNILCLVEKTYFVEILSESADDYKVNYNGVIGYVKKNEVTPVSGTPTTPFPLGITLVLGSNCNLRKTPTTKSIASNVISTLNKNESNITFIGRVFSEEVIDFGGNTWYYVICNGEKGYIYNQYLKSASPIYPNTEEISEYKASDFVTVSPLDTPSSIMTIIILFVPCIAILIILYLPIQKFNHKHQKTKSKTLERY